MVPNIFVAFPVEYMDCNHLYMLRSFVRDGAGDGPTPGEGGGGGGALASTPFISGAACPTRVLARGLYVHGGTG